MRVHKDRDVSPSKEDGPAIIRPDGAQEWWLHDKLHREDGPAIIRSDGSEFWYVRGDLHREDGPAVIWKDGSKEWWIHGEKVDLIKHLVLTSK